MSHDLQGVIREHGQWTAMAIKLRDGSYTRQSGPDYRLRRLLQVAADLVHKPLSQCRVLDLGCLEGHFAIEFFLSICAAVTGSKRTFFLSIRYALIRCKAA